MRGDSVASYAVTMDDLSLYHPSCPTDGVLLREVGAGWECPECGRFESAMSGPLPPEFDGPGIHGG
ncbi:hypothetical protein DC31_13995 [Microbacterium sp. CH12i]|nr:hypothetical protein DC31_13995 [Microbacterium sp. CH12i]